MHWASPWPVYVASAWGSHFHCVDGIDHVDFCLGDTAAMGGHAPAPVVRAMHEQAQHGSAFMLSTRRSAQAAELLAERFGLPCWRFTATTADALRALIRASRRTTGRDRIVVSDGGTPVPPVAQSSALSVVAFNDIAALRGALAEGDVAAVVLEPALTRSGIVLAEPGYLEEAAAVCREAAAVLVLDESRSVAAGPGGCARALGVDEPDALVLGPAVGGGAAVAAFGMRDEFAARIREARLDDALEMPPHDGAMAGGPMSIVAVLATLSEVLTESAWETMRRRAVQWAEGVQSVIDEYGLPWHVSLLGARAAYAFRRGHPIDGGDAAAARDGELQRYLHLHALNRGILMTPGHGMALMSPEVTSEDIARHTEHFREAVASLYTPVIH